MAAQDILPPTEDAKMNMTPMIDMTFLLVVFFMLTIDLSSKEFFPVDLPYASQGVDDKKPEKGLERLVINLERNGTVHFKGETFDLSAGQDAGLQDDALQSLQDHLRQIHRDAGGMSVREPDGASKIPVMIHADWGAKWKYVQWIMQACAQQDIKIYKVQFAVKKPAPENGK
jgi:biopolymer transport protein ExbD